MRSFIATLAVLVSSAAIACPNLAGKYACKNGEGEPDSIMQVNQVEENGVTTYSMVDAESTTVLVTDGQARKFESSEDGVKQVTTRVSVCAAEAVNWQESIEFINEQDGEKAGEINLNVLISRGQNGELMANGHADLDVGGEKKTDKISESCALVP